MFLVLYQANAAGQKYLDLVHKAWKTYFVHNIQASHTVHTSGFLGEYQLNIKKNGHLIHHCLLYTSDAADDMQCVDLGGRRIIKKFDGGLSASYA